MDYDRLLDRGMMAVPKRSESGERFEVPKAVVEPAGRRTIVVNITEIASAVRRDPAHLIKFLLKELATKGELSGKRLFLLGVFTPSTIDGKVESYVKRFVLCEECSKPDTRISRDGKYMVMKCEACGARSTAK